MNITVQARALITRMSPETLKAYKDSFRNDIVSMIIKVERATMWLYLLSISLAVISLLLSLWSLDCLVKARPINDANFAFLYVSLFALGLLGLFGCSVFPLNYTHPDLPKLNTFCTWANSLLLVTKAECTLSFEEQVKQTVLNAAKSTVLAERAYQEALNRRVSPTYMQICCQNEISSRQHLEETCLRASYFGYYVERGELMKLAMGN